MECGRRTHNAGVPQDNVLLEAWPALNGVLPAGIGLQILAQHHARGQVAQSLRTGATFSSWIGVLKPDGLPEFALQPLPTLLGHSRHCGLPFVQTSLGIWTILFERFANLPRR